MNPTRFIPREPLEGGKMYPKAARIRRIPRTMSYEDPLLPDLHRQEKQKAESKA